MHGFGNGHGPVAQHVDVAGHLPNNLTVEKSGQAIPISGIRFWFPSCLKAYCHTILAQASNAPWTNDLRSIFQTITTAVCSLQQFIENP